MMNVVVAIFVVVVLLFIDTTPTTHGWMTTTTTTTTSTRSSTTTKQQPQQRHDDIDRKDNSATTTTRRRTTTTTILHSVAPGSADNNKENNNDDDDGMSPTNRPFMYGRRKLLQSTISGGIVAGATMMAKNDAAYALVKGVAPPPPKKKAGSGGGGIGGEERKCTNVEECQAMAEKREAELRAKEESGPPPSVTKGGVRYRDIDTGAGSGSGSNGGDSGESPATVVVTAKEGDEVDVYYKVLKLGKRSYDGISGEATVVFSRGYGLEDDETKPGEKSFKFKVGSPTNIVALNEAVVGMSVGSTRRFSITPQMGWEKAIAACDGGPGGRGTGGDLKTDYVVVPTATMVEQEACFDKSKQPFPTTYAQQRRMAQRFDQSLIMEIQLVDIVSSS